MDEALVENAQHDIDRDDGGQDQQQLIAQRRLEAEGRPLEGGKDGGGQADLRLRRLRRIDAGAQRDAGGEVEGDIGRGKLALMVDLQRGRLFADLGESREGYLPAGRRGRGEIDGIQRLQRFCRAGSASRMTRYWLDWVKMVETMRWPKAS